jgi:hypothetical protein
MATFSAIATINYEREIYVVLGFFLLVGSQILRMVQEQSREARRSQIGDPEASRAAEQETSSHPMAESSTSSFRGTLRRAT